MEDMGITYLLTADQSLSFQQNLKKYKVILIVLAAFDVRLKTLIPRVSEIEQGIMEADISSNVIEVDLRLK